MRRGVYDANVWISAFLRPGSVPDRAIDAARDGLLLPLTSDVLIDQVVRSLLRLGFSTEESDRTEAQMRILSSVIVPRLRLSVITAKESDNRVLECAVAGEADVIVTGDRKHLLPPGSYAGIPILSPREFLDPLNRTDPL
jgi:putative PIN family toxin of toxin-antitoxin system